MAKPWSKKFSKFLILEKKIIKRKTGSENTRFKVVLYHTNTYICENHYGYNWVISFLGSAQTHVETTPHTGQGRGNFSEMKYPILSDSWTHFSPPFVVIIFFQRKRSNVVRGIAIRQFGISQRISPDKKMASFAGHSSVTHVLLHCYT